MLELKHVFKDYAVNSDYVLNNINLRLVNGLISIEGSSGSGKSTLLNLVGLLDKPSKGVIYLDNKNTNSLKKYEIDYLHNKKIGFIFQNYNLIEYLTVYQNITLTHKSKNVDNILKELNIYDLKNKKVNKLSGGEKGRVAIARVLVQNPDILLCDEPTGALDSKTGELIMDILKKISKTKLIIMVTHNHEYSLKYADRIIIIKDGTILDDSLSLDNNLEIKKTKYKKVHFSKIKLLRIVFIKLITKYKRNLLTSIAFSIGLISLLLVLGIKNGFNISLDNYNKEYASNYPIYISPNTIDQQEELNNMIKDKKIKNDKVYSVSENHINNIDKEYIDYINNKEKLIKYKIYSYYIDNKTIVTIPNNNTEDFYNKFELIKGRFITNDFESIIVLDSSNSINSTLLEEIGLNDKEYNYTDLIDYEYQIYEYKYKIVGILKIKSDDMINLDSCILYKDIYDEIPTSISLYPNNLDDKNTLVKYLKEYKSDIRFTDYSETIKSISNVVIKSSSIILIAFSIISLVVSCFMIGILTYINVLECIHEIGLFKSLGISNHDIRLIFIIEKIIIAIFASFISLMVVLLISYPINNLLYKYTSLENILLLNESIIGLIILISIIISIIGSLLPVLGISRLKIIDALKYE